MTWGAYLAGFAGGVTAMVAAAVAAAWSMRRKMRALRRPKKQTVMRDPAGTEFLGKPGGYEAFIAKKYEDR